MSDSASRLWDAYLASGSPEARAALAAGATYTAWQFGYGVEQGNRLLACVLDGPKRATTGALWAYEAEGEAVPAPGDHSVLLDGHGVARCIIRSTQVDVLPFEEVDEAFAYDEGEGDRSLKYWRDVHWKYFSRELEELGREATPDMPVVCERFEVVFRGATDDDPAEYLAPIASLVSKSEKAQLKLAPGTWQHTMLENNVAALRIAYALMRGQSDATARPPAADLQAALEAMASMISRTENTRTKFEPGTSQHTLQRNRLNALRYGERLIRAELDKR